MKIVNDKVTMTESNVQSNNLPYRARIMMSASADTSNNCNKTSLLSSKFSNVQNMKPLNARKEAKSSHSYSANTSYADLQPLQWLHQDALLSITPIDNEDEYVPGKDDIVSVSTSPIKVDVVAEEPRSDETNSGSNSTIADFYRYQAMRAAMAGGHANGMRSHSGCQQPNEYQKPPFSYTHIIFMAIETSPNKAMTVNDIYVWCETHFPYYTQAGMGWKNSLRHNLSINKSFKKISRDGRGGPGRGAYWIVEPRERNNLIDAIRRSPCSLGGFPFIGNTVGHQLRTIATNHTNAFNPNTATLPRATVIGGNNNNSIINQKPNCDATAGILPHSTSRGSLLRIGGQITDASQLINRATATPVIQRLRDNSHNVIDLTTTIPLIQLDQLNFDQSIESGGKFEYQTVDDSEIRGKVIVPNMIGELEPELEHAFFDMINNLVHVEIDNSTKNGLKSINCPEHGGRKQRKLSQRSTSNSNSGHDSAVVEDMPSSESTSALIIKKHPAKLKKKCTCSKPESESEESEISYSNDEFSEMSDTDFNAKMIFARRNRHKEKQSVLCNKNKSFSKSRKGLQSRSRINSITRAPHSDHVYAFLQDFLIPVNLSDKDIHNQSVTNTTNSTSNVASVGCSSGVISIGNNNGSNMGSILDSNTSSSLKNYLSNCVMDVNKESDDKSLSLDLSMYSFSKRTKSKLESVKESSRPTYYHSDSDNEYNSNCNNDSLSFDFFNRNKSSSNTRYQTIKQMKRSFEQIADDSEKEEQENRFISEIVRGDEIDATDDEDDDNGCISDRNTVHWIKRERVDQTWLSASRNNNIKNTLLNFNNHHNHSNNKHMLTDQRDLNFEKNYGDKPVSLIKRKVGRPRKVDSNLIGCQKLKNCKSKISDALKLKKKIKTECGDVKSHLRESNINTKIDDEFSVNEEEVAINILANLHRKTQRERISNMYQMTSFVDGTPDRDMPADYAS